MKRILICSTCLLLLANTTWAAKIQNHTNQELVIKLNSGNIVKLLPQATTDISDRELSTPQLQNLISNGQVAVIKSTGSKKSVGTEKKTSFPPISGKTR